MARTTYASSAPGGASSGCWVAAAGPYTARARQERPLGEPPRGRRHDPDRHVPDRPHDVRQRGEPRRPLPLPAPPLRRLVGRGSRPRRPTTPSSTSPAARQPPFAGGSEGMWQQPRPYPFSRWSSTTCARSCRARAPGSSSTRRPAGRRSAASAAEGRAARRPALAAAGRRAGDRDRHARAAPRLDEPRPGKLRSGMADREFAELQQRLRALWPSVTLRSIGDVERTVVVVHSISMDVPDQLIPVFPAYEERFLCLVLSLLRSRNSRVIYVTSQPILPRLIDYYFGLVPELDTPEARSRFAVVSLVDGRNLPLTKKLLGRPGAIERIRALVAQPELAFLLPFATSPRRGRARRPPRDPALRRRPEARVARDEDRQPAGLRRRGRAACARLRRRPTNATSCGRCRELRSRDGDRQARPRRQRPRQRARRRPARALGEGKLGPALTLEDTEAGVARLPGGARRPGRDRRGADRGRGLPQPERAAADQPVGPGRHPLHPRPGARRPARPDVLRLPLPRRPGVRAAGRGRGAEGRAPTGA